MDNKEKSVENWEKARLRDAELISEASKAAETAEIGLAKFLLRGLEAGQVLFSSESVKTPRDALRAQGIDWREIIIQIAEFLLLLLKKFILGK